MGFIGGYSFLDDVLASGTVPDIPATGVFCLLIKNNIMVSLPRRIVSESRPLVEVDMVALLVTTRRDWYLECTILDTGQE